MAQMGSMGASTKRKLSKIQATVGNCPMFSRKVPIVTLLDYRTYRCEEVGILSHGPHRSRLQDQHLFIRRFTLSGGCGERQAGGTERGHQQVSSGSLAPKVSLQQTDMADRIHQLDKTRMSVVRERTRERGGEKQRQTCEVCMCV